MHAYKFRFIAATLLFPLASLTAGRMVAQGPGDPPSTVARITFLRGDVSLQAAGTDDWSDAPPNYPMVGGDRIYTSSTSRLLLQLGGAELRIGGSTDVTLTNLTDDFEQLALSQGSVRLRVFEIDQDSQIEVDTPNGAVLISTPGDYRIDANPQQGSSDVVVNAGNAQLTGPNVNFNLAGGYAMQMYGTDPIQIQYEDFPPFDSLDEWSVNLDRRYQDSVSARYVSRQMVGYADLDANGSWSPESEYGPVWYPNNVPDGWRPYSAGHWAYVAPWGYTWVDDAPWGFAPFHYGRWAVVQGRWGWIPGPPAVRPVYSPALVAFVGGGPGLSVGISIGGGGGGVAAWFPIGVGEPYVPWYHCTPTYARQVNTSNVNIAVIRNTTIVNNYNTYITNVHVTNTTVINNTNVTENHFNYANRASVTAVPVAAMSSGTSVARQQVRLSPQQQQQLAVAPISVKPTAPVPATPHPSLVAKTNVPQPAARPTVMTPTGQAKAVPSAVHAKPVVVSALPAPKVVPKNAAPAPHPVTVATPTRPNQPAPAAPATAAKPGAPATAAPIQRPALPTAAAPTQKLGQPTPPAPVTRPVQPVTGTVKPTTPAGKPTPAAVTTPEPTVKPVPGRPTGTPATAAPITRPAPAPASTASPAKPIAPVTRPVPPAAGVAPVRPGQAVVPAKPEVTAPARPVPATVPLAVAPKTVPPAKTTVPPAKPAAGKPANDKNAPKKDPDTKDDKDQHQ